MLYKIEMEDRETNITVGLVIFLSVYLVPHISHVALHLRLLLNYCQGLVMWHHVLYLIILIQKLNSVGEGVLLPVL